jgi:hypothetical protein
MIVIAKAMHFAGQPVPLAVFIGDEPSRYREFLNFFYITHFLAVHSDF